jgi:hypothetical protein
VIRAARERSEQERDTPPLDAKRHHLFAWSLKLLGRRQPAPRAHLFWRVGFPAIVVAAGLAVFLLAREGGKAVLDTRFETVQEPILLQPDEPGYLELVGVTPTLLSLHTDNGELVGVTFMASTGIDAGGGIVLLPSDLLTVPEGEAVEQGEPISELYAQGGADAVERIAEELFGIGFDDVVEITTESLADSMGPAGPLPFPLVDDLAEADAEGVQQVLYEAGTYDFSAADAAMVYAFRNADEADVNRLQRQRTLWESWLGVIGRSGNAAASSPPPSSPLSPFIPVLGSGTAVVEVPPLHSIVVDPASPPRYTLGEDGRSWLRARALELVPWPRQPESFQRPRVKLLDGTGDPSIRDGVVEDVIAAGGVIAVIGNAAEFGVETTHFAYHREDLVNDPFTNTIAIVLGVDMALIELGEDTPDVVDITVTVGSDQAAR